MRWDWISGIVIALGVWYLLNMFTGGVIGLAGAILIFILYMKLSNIPVS